MARSAQKSAFDINAYLNSNAAADKRSLLSVVADSTENLVQRISYRTGKAAESLSGTTDVFALGKKVGAVAAAKRTEDFRARAHAEIEKLING